MPFRTKLPFKYKSYDDFILIAETLIGLGIKSIELSDNSMQKPWWIARLASYGTGSGGINLVADHPCGLEFRWSINCEPEHVYEDKLNPSRELLQLMKSEMPGEAFRDTLYAFSVLLYGAYTTIKVMRDSVSDYEEFFSATKDFGMAEGLLSQADLDRILNQD